MTTFLAIFVKPASGGLCSFHIQPITVATESQAQQFCTNAGGSLANIENAIAQEALENVFYDSYGSSNLVSNMALPLLGFCFIFSHIINV